MATKVNETFEQDDREESRLGLANVISEIATELELGRNLVGLVIKAYLAKTRKKLTTRQQIQRDLLQQCREDAIKASLEIKMGEALANRLTTEEKELATALMHRDTEEQIQEWKLHETIAIIRLETLKEMRDGRPVLNTKENRELVSQSSDITAKGL